VSDGSTSASRIRLPGWTRRTSRSARRLLLMGWTSGGNGDRH